jgi:hypothetical protein
VIKRIYSKIWRRVDLAFFCLKYHTIPMFKQRHGYDLNLKEPKSFSEKVQWFKLYGRLEYVSKYVDKYMVREFVKSTLGEKYLIPMIGIYEKVNEIIFDLLPNSFVIKATHGSGWNILVPDKSNIEWITVKNQMNDWLSSNYYNWHGEPQYRSLKRRIIIENYIRDASGDLKDYKFFCINGYAKFILVYSERNISPKTDVYDLEWNRLPIKLGRENLAKPAAKPEALDEMLQISHTLSRGFPFVRVDLYFSNGRIYFGELTFTPGNGMTNIDPVEYDYLFGSYLDLIPYNKEKA